MRTLLAVLAACLSLLWFVSTAADEEATQPVTSYSFKPRFFASDEELLNYASTPFDKQRNVPGPTRYRGKRLEFTYLCSDLCPDYTRRVIHYHLERPWDMKAECAELDGVVKRVRVPSGITMSDEPFCIPRVLAENWDSVVVRMYELGKVPDFR